MTGAVTPAMSKPFSGPGMVTLTGSVIQDHDRPEDGSHPASGHTPARRPGYIDTLPSLGRRAFRVAY